MLLSSPDVSELDIGRIAYLLAISAPEPERFQRRIKRTLEIARPQDCYWEWTKIQVWFDAKALKKFSETTIKREWWIRYELISVLPIVIEKSTNKEPLIEFLADLLLNPEDVEMAKNILRRIEKVVEKKALTPGIVSKIISSVIQKYKQQNISEEERLYLWRLISKLYRYPTEELREFLETEKSTAGERYCREAARAVLAGKTLRVGAPPYSIISLEIEEDE
jgi:hypothetical protein